MNVKSRISKKLTRPGKGPYRVIETIGPVTYRVRKVEALEEQVIHVNRLKKYFGDMEEDSEEEEVVPEDIDREENMSESEEEEDKKEDITAISLRGVAEYPEPNSSYESEKLQVRVLQRSEVEHQHVWTCLVEITRRITYCGMHSHSSVVSGGLFSYIHRVGAEECNAMHRTRMYVLQRQTIGDILLNGTTTAAVNLHVYIDNSGSSEGISYQENGMTWNNVVITASVKITTMDYYTKVKLKDNVISFFKLLFKRGSNVSFLGELLFQFYIRGKYLDVQTGCIL